jgi:hypothetical protein
MIHAWNDEDEKKFAALKARWIEANAREMEIGALVRAASERDDVKVIQDLDNRRRHQSAITDLIWDDFLPLLRSRNAPSDDNA